MLAAMIESDKNFSQFGKVGVIKNGLKLKSAKIVKLDKTILRTFENLVPSKREMDAKMEPDSKILFKLLQIGQTNKVGTTCDEECAQAER